MTIESMKEWLDSWGSGPNWSDASGATVPVTRESLAAVLEYALRMKSALVELRDRALNHAPNSAREFSPATATSIACICEQALNTTASKERSE